MGSGCARSGLIALILAAAPVLGAECEPGTLSLRAPDGAQAEFRVDVANDNAERAQGLMFREKMASSSGMLFVYETPRRASFWMKNTLIPLDLIFADQTGRVTRVHPNAIPQDTTAIDGGTDVRFVLEINGGLAARLGIAPGHEIQHPAINPAVAAWPCAD